MPAASSMSGDSAVAPRTAASAPSPTFAKTSVIVLQETVLVLESLLMTKPTGDHEASGLGPHAVDRIRFGDEIADRSTRMNRPAPHQWLWMVRSITNHHASSSRISHI